jgi:hypothetical protein
MQLKQSLGGENEDVYGINYNKWFEDKSYREQICKDIDIPFTDEGINYVPPDGRGSSFNKRKFNGKAQEMGVLERYKSMLENPKFMKIVSLDKEVIELTEEHFGIKFPYDKSPEEIQEKADKMLAELDPEEVEKPENYEENSEDKKV